MQHALGRWTALVIYPVFYSFCYLVLFIKDKENSTWRMACENIGQDPIAHVPLLPPSPELRSKPIGACEKYDMKQY